MCINGMASRIWEFMQKNTPISQYIIWIDEINRSSENFLKGYSYKTVKYNNFFQLREGFVPNLICSSMGSFKKQKR